MNKKYEKAYVEVLEVLNKLPKQDYEKIPSEKIDFFESHKDINYNYNYDPSLNISEQEISQEAGNILISLYRDYFCTEIQKEKLNKILWQNENIRQEKLKEKYNKNIFESNEDKIEESVENKESAVNDEPNQKELIEYKKTNFIQKIFRFIKEKLKFLK